MDVEHKVEPVTKGVHIVVQFDVGVMDGTMKNRTRMATQWALILSIYLCWLELTTRTPKGALELSKSLMQTRRPSQRSPESSRICTRLGREVSPSH